MEHHKTQLTDDDIELNLCVETDPASTKNIESERSVFRWKCLFLFELIVTVLVFFRYFNPAFPAVMVRHLADLEASPDSRIVVLSANLTEELGLVSPAESNVVCTYSESCFYFKEITTYINLCEVSGWLLLVHSDGLVVDCESLHGFRSHLLASTVIGDVREDTFEAWLVRMAVQALLFSTGLLAPRLQKILNAREIANWIFSGTFEENKTGLGLFCLNCFFYFCAVFFGWLLACCFVMSLIPV